MDYKQIIGCVRDHNIQGAYLVNDLEGYLTDILIKSLREDLLEESLVDFNFDWIQREKINFADIYNSCETLPLGKGPRIVVVEGISLSRDGVKENKELLDELGGYLEGISKSTVFVIISRNQKAFNGSFFKKFDKHGTVVNIDRLVKNELINFIGNKITKAGRSVSKTNVNYIAENIGYLDKDSSKSLYDVDNEIHKIIQRGTGVVSLDEIKEVMIENYDINVFEFLDALSQRNSKESYRAYHKLRKKKTDDFMVFYMIARQVRNLIQVKLIKEKGIGLNNSGTGLSNFELKKLDRFVKFFSLEDLTQIHQQLYKSEVSMKTTSEKIDVALEKIIYFFAKK